jgi:hypothetical protein
MQPNPRTNTHQQLIRHRNHTRLPSTRTPLQIRNPTSNRRTPTLQPTKNHIPSRIKLLKPRHIHIRITHRQHTQRHLKRLTSTTPVVSHAPPSAVMPELRRSRWCAPHPTQHQTYAGPNLNPRGHTPCANQQQVTPDSRPAPGNASSPHGYASNPPPAKPHPAYYQANPSPTPDHAHAHHSTSATSYPEHSTPARHGPST